MKHSDTIGKLAAALVSAQAELRAVGMDAMNPHFKSRYASLDNIIETIRPTLARHGLAVVQGTTTPESDANNTVKGFTVETMLVHASGEWMANAVVMPLSKADPQGAGSALTYGRRYGLSALLSLATDEDDDGNTTKQRSGTAGASNGARQTGSRTDSPSKATHTTTSATQPTPPFGPEDVLMPIGKQKGQPIGALDDETLRSAVQWMREKNWEKKYPGFIDAVDAVISARVE